MRRTIKLAAIRGDEVLLVYKGETGQWSLPGGKARDRQKEKRRGRRKIAPILRREKDTRCLRRELTEEIPRLKIRKLRRYHRFNSVYTNREPFTITVYFGKASGALRTAKEIDAAAWMRTWRRVPLSLNTKRALEQMVKDGYLPG